MTCGPGFYMALPTAIGGDRQSVRASICAWFDMRPLPYALVALADFFYYFFFPRNTALAGEVDVLSSARCSLTGGPYVLSRAQQW
jgi:hypothetical protein